MSQYTQITAIGELILTITSKNDWIKKCPSQLPPKKYSGEEWLWLDKNGNALSNGADWEAAEVKETYPVSIYRLVRVSAI